MTPDRLTQAEFADYIGVNKSTVTRLKQAGRLVISADARVDVAASVARIEATRGQRHDVAQRWEDARRGAAAALPEPAAATVPDSSTVPEDDHEALDVDQIGRRTRLAQMRKAEAEAEARMRQNAIEASTLIAKSDVLRDMATATGIIHNAAESLPDRVTPLITGEADATRIRAVLRDEVEQLLAAVAELLEAVGTGRAA
jgi:transcriptional regulator with XRE-family HTH domain